jgi:hypothetical protein
MFIKIFDWILIFLSWGHFYFAYVYSFKKIGLKHFLYYCAISFLFSFSVFSQFNTSQKLYIFLVIFIFLIHNTIDLFRFKKENQAIMILSSGFVFLLAFMFIDNLISGLLIKLIVIYHYFFWYFYYKFPSVKMQKSFYKEILYKHLFLTLIILFLCSVGLKNFIRTIFSTEVFYFMTMHHVIFSYLSRNNNVFTIKKQIF